MRFPKAALAALIVAIPGGAESAAELAEHPTWLKLGHYEADRSSPDGVRSAVQSPRFFLAPDGPTNPAAELAATLVALTKPAGDDADAHAQCRFPARFMWLRSRGQLDGVAEIDCPALDEWIHGSATESISVVFATGYLGNPASYYGHTLLKFNAGDTDASDLLDVTVNYGAIIPDGIGPLAYIYNGATGGFDAGFSHIDYYFHEHNYGETELRDLWEYELNLSKPEVDFIVAHTWELLGHEYTYYFFRRNCAYRMAEVLRLVEGVEIIPRRRPWTVPQSVVRLAAESERRGEPLVNGVRYYPSRQALFRARYRDLDTAEQRAAKRALALDPAESAPAALAELEPHSQHRIIEALLDYLQYRMPRDEPADSRLSRQYLALLAARFRLPPTEQVEPPRPRLGPETDRPPGYMSIGVMVNDRDESGAVLRLRPAYYDVLDSAASHVAHSELSMGDLVLSTRGGDLRVQSAWLFRVESVSGAESGLPGDNGKSWRLALGAAEQAPGCTDCIVARFDADIGRAVPLGSRLVAGLYVGGTVQDNRNDQGNLLARATGFANVALTPRLRAQLRLEQRYHVDGRPDWEQSAELRARYALTRRIDLRLDARYDDVAEGALSIGYYW